MATEAHYRGSAEALDHTPAAALTAGEVVQLADGRAGFTANSVAAGKLAALQVCGLARVAKAASVVLLDGQNVYWDHSANVATYRRTNNRDFLIGVAHGDAASAATTVDVVLNEETRYQILLGRDPFTSEATLGLGVSDLVGQPGVKLAFDAVAEIAQAAFYSDDTVAVASNPILEAWVAVHDIGDAAALDINIGLASGSHATDFEAIAEFVAVHFDGADLSILVHSDDDTTDVAPVDSTIDAVDDIKFFLQIDARDPDDVQVYVNGVDAVPDGTTLKLTAASGPLKPIAHIEKTSDDTTADVRLLALGVRTSEG